MFLFFFNDTATTEIYTLSLHDALPISGARARARVPDQRRERPGQRERMESDEVPEAERRRPAPHARTAAVRGDPARGHRAAVPQRVLGQPPAGDLCGCRVG